MKFVSLVAISLFLSLSACSWVKPHEKLAQDEAQKVGLTAIKKPHFDASFASPAVNFSQYKKAILQDLDLSSVKVIYPTNLNHMDGPWVLNDSDKQYYQEKYRDSAKKKLFDSGLYLQSSTAAVDTLIVKAKITEIAPLGSKDDMYGRPVQMDVYTRGFGRMTIVFEVYDSLTNKLVAITTDEHDLGQMWEKNDRVQNNVQIKLAFEFWLQNMKDELSSLSKG